MKEELIEFGKYYISSIVAKTVSLYVLPSVVLGLPYYSETSFDYLKCAVASFTFLNFIVQVLFSTRYKYQVPLKFLIIVINVSQANC